ncbi:MAG: FAD-dependent oxidoreductase [Lacunisphaera sp.]
MVSWSMDADVIVIGAGIAGLAAARRLGRNGRRRDRPRSAGARPAGRILTEYPRGLAIPVELGPEFVHGGNPLLRAALRQAGMRLRRVRRDMWVRDGEGLRRLHTYWTDLARLSARIPPRTKESFADFLRRERRLAPAERARWRAFVEGFNAAPAGRMSASSIRLEHSGGRCAPVTAAAGLSSAGGFARRSAAAAEDFLEIQCAGHGGALAAGRGWRSARGGRLFRARAAIITLPLGIWQAGAVRFTPPLREKRRIVRRLGWGQVVRVTLRFDPDFWRSCLLPAALHRRGRANFGFFSVPGQDFPSWWAPSPGAPLLVGWNGGPAGEAAAEIAAGGARDAGVARAGGGLGPAGGGGLRRHLRGAWSHNWAQDPWDAWRVQLPGRRLRAGTGATRAARGRDAVLRGRGDRGRTRHRARRARERRARGRGDFAEVKIPAPAPGH